MSLSVTQRLYWCDLGECGFYWCDSVSEDTDNHDDHDDPDDPDEPDDSDEKEVKIFSIL